MQKIESYQHSNISEEEMGQNHAIDFALNAIAEVRRNIPSGASLESCADCGDRIPEARRTAMPGCCRCIQCQGLFELQK